MNTTQEQRKELGAVATRFLAHNLDSMNIDPNKLRELCRDADLAGELLEALEAIVSDDHPDTRIRPSHLDAAHKAIAKAHGEAQDG